MDGKRILLIQPSLAAPGRWTFSPHGLHFWLDAQLDQAGIESELMLRDTPEITDWRELPQSIPSDDEVAAAMAKAEARWGLHSVFEKTPQDTTRLVSAKLFEAIEPDDDGEDRSPPRVRTVAEWKFDGIPEDLPRQSVEILRNLARQIRFSIGLAKWTDRYDTSDAELALYFLKVLGALQVVEAGYTIDRDSTFAATHNLISCIYVGMRPARDLFPRLMDALLDTGSTDIWGARVAASDAIAAADLDAPPDDWLELFGSLDMLKRSIIN